MLWVTGFILAGYLFGNIPFVAEHFYIVFFAIIAVSFVGGGAMVLDVRKV